MIKFIKRIIQRMKQYARRYCSICFSAFILLIVGMIPVLIALDGKWYQGLALIILATIALICLVVTIITFTFDTITTFRKHRLLKILQHLRGYLIDMSRLGRDVMAENNDTALGKLLKRFQGLHTEIGRYIKHRTPDELAVWEKPLDNQLAIAIKESIGRLEGIISKYESLVSE